MATTVYTYGSFVLHDGVNYFLTQKNFDLPEFKQTLFQIARLEGVKKTGERLNEKQIPVFITVVGASRADLESKLDALYGALAVRQQPLALHALDNRYYIADALTGRAQLAPGKVLAVSVPVTFICQQPFAYAPSQSTSAPGAQVMPQVQGQTTLWQLPAPLSISAGGNYFARPTLTLLNQTSGNVTTLTSALVSGTPYTSLSVAALPVAASSGQVFLLINGTTFQRVTLAASALQGATTLSVNSFNANANYAATTTSVQLDTYLQAFTLTQQPDGQVLTVTTLPVAQFQQNALLTINCDPTSAGGFTVQSAVTSPATYVAFAGNFPVLEPVSTTFALQVTCSTQPTVLLTVTWTARWLS